MALTKVQTELIADGSITTDKLADDAVTAAKIVAGAVVADIANDSIDSQHYVAASIDNEHLADDAVDSAEIAAGAIDTAHIADDQITLAKMAGLARGKIIIGDSSGNPTALALGTSGYVLKSDGNDIAWAADATVAQLTTEEVQDITGAMFSSNTETGITVTYQDGDGTIDLVIATLNQDTTGTAANLSGTPNISVGTIGSGNITTTGYLAGPASFVIDPATVGDDTGVVVIAGGLQVDGTTTTINSTTLTVDDLNIVLASGAANSAAANGAGITIDGASATMLYTHATTSFDFNKPVNVTGTMSVSGVATFSAVPVLPANSIDSDHYVDGSIDNAHLADDAVGIAELSATGTASSSTFLRGDNTWTAIASSPITALNNATANELVTVGSTTTELDAEATLTYDGLHLGMTSNHANHPSDANVIQVGGNAAIQGKTATGAGKSFRIMQNVYDDASAGLSYISTDEASHYTQVNGTHSFNVAASGSADAAISFTEAILIDAAGQVCINTNSIPAAAKLTVHGPVRLTNSYLYLRTGTHSGLWVEDAYNLRFGTSDTERMVIAANGDVSFDSFSYSAASDQMTINNGLFLSSGYIRSGAADFSLGTASQGVLATLDDGTGAVNFPKQPMFGGGRNAGYMTDDQVWVADRMDHANVGSHYNTSNGKFTAPVAGTYFFSANMLTADGSGSVQAEWHYRKNDSVVKSFRQHTIGAYHMNMAGQLVITLAANDYIEIYVADSGTSSGWLGSQLEYNSVCGFLIG